MAKIDTLSRRERDQYGRALDQARVIKSSSRYRRKQESLQHNPKYEVKLSVRLAISRRSRGCTVAQGPSAVPRMPW